MAGKKIIDVSEHQGKINWEKARDYIDGAIIRIGYGDDIRSQDDKYAAYNINECVRLGIPFAVYIYSYAASEKQIRSEIAHTKRVCAGCDEPVAYWLDLEERAYTGIWRKAAELWVEAFGGKAGVYSWQWAFEQQLKGLESGRWICAYGTNSGKPEPAYKPTIWADGWQYTSKGRIPGISGDVDVSEWYSDDFGESAKKKPAAEGRAVTKKEVAAIIMRHLATHKDHGYTQDMEGRQGTGQETIDIYGHKYTISGWDRDCSSAVISAYESAGISCGEATYTGNMRECMVASGNFRVRSMAFTAQMGDCYLNEENHTAMCMSAIPDILAEFSINEKGGTLGGKTGDQLQKGEHDETLGRGESHLKEYYDYPWDMILECINDEVAFVIGEEQETVESETEAPSMSHETALCAALAILGEYGNSNDRRKALGSKYEAVQAAVDNVLLHHRTELAEAMAAFIERA